MTEQAVPYVVKEPNPTGIPARYEDVRYPDGSLAFRVDRARLVVEIQRRREKHYFDLASTVAEPIDNHE